MISKFDSFLLESNEKKTYLQQVINVLSKSQFPLSIDEICDEINTNGEIIIPKTSYRSVSTIVLSHTRGKELTSSARARNKIGRFYFEVVSDRPQKFKLVEGYDEFKNKEYFDLGSDIIDYEDDEEGFNSEKKYKFIEAAQICLQNNNNRPMSSQEIWEEISDKVQYTTKTPVASLNTILNTYAENSNYKSKKKTNLIFKIVSDRPMKYVLLNPDSEIQDGLDDDFDFEDDEDYDIKPFRLSDASQIEKELKRAQAQPEKTKAQIQAQREKIKSNKLAQAQGKRVKNPFIQAICVLGESGAGKSYTISQILKSEGHEFQFIIPTAATTGLLSQYSPRKKEYVPSRLSQMIIEAYANPKILYTAVFDECHKSNVIEMINDELLQAISIRRNDGKRFISLDDDTSEQVFGDVYKKIERGNILIPDNLGFIFISSNPRVIGGNPDFLNRVDLVELTEDKRDEFRTSKDLASMNLKKRDEKLKLIEKLRSM